MKFSGLDELKAQIMRDADAARQRSLIRLSKNSQALKESKLQVGRGPAKRKPMKVDYKTTVFLPKPIS